MAKGQRDIPIYGWMLFPIKKCYGKKCCLESVYVRFFCMIHLSISRKQKEGCDRSWLRCLIDDLLARSARQGPVWLALWWVPYLRKTDILLDLYWWWSRLLHRSTFRGWVLLDRGLPEKKNQFRTQHNSFKRGITWNWMIRSCERQRYILSVSFM